MLPATLKDWIKHYGVVFGTSGFLMNRLLRSAKLQYDRIVCASEWTANELRSFPKLQDRVFFVPNGVNLEDFDPAQKIDRPVGKIRLLSIGRLVATKGHRYGIEALSYLKTEYPSLCLRILGDGPLKEELLLLCQKFGVSDSVEFLPPVSHDQMPSLYLSSDFFFMPSVWEGFPVSLLEAMASKLPIVATNIQGIDEIVNCDSAVLARAEDPADLAEKLRWAIEHPKEMESRAENAFGEVSRYRWEMTAVGELETMSAKEMRAENPKPSVSA
jgi:glycosyltransferase involved in cell wall biosynthesis